MTTSLLIWAIALFVGHFVADWIMQSRYIAENKSKNNWVLAIHTTDYMMWMLVITMIPAGIIGLYSSYWFLVWILVNGLLHGCTDWFTSRFNAKMYTTGQMKLFWWGIGFDQMIHYVTLFVTAYILLF